MNIHKLKPLANLKQTELYREANKNKKGSLEKKVLGAIWCTYSHSSSREGIFFIVFYFHMKVGFIYAISFWKTGEQKIFIKYNERNKTKLGWNDKSYGERKQFM